VRSDQIMNQNGRLAKGRNTMGASMHDDGFAGRTVLVFGAAGALGAGVAAAFAETGASVTGVDRVVPEGDRRLAGVSYEAADVADDTEVAAVFDAGAAPWAVVNTVGGFAPQRPLAELNPAELTGQLTLNLVTAALITKHALRGMQAAGAGRVVHTASRAAVVSKGSGFAYSVSKLGVLHLVSMAADEVRGTGVTVNCVVPSIIDTPANRAAIPNADYDAWPKIPDIARTYLYLAAPSSGLVNGAAVPV
jgi:NAD(P)-dependent dehydrogenase (short-subunit alcohol dehydrogenase family)